ncbi:MAG: nickel-responsive transcriptional regulator NikR [Minicystis sp.]
MSDLVRFGVAMDRALLADFDERIAERGYENRSEALRDLIRADLTRAAWDGGAQVVATLTIVYDTDVRELITRLTEGEGQSLGALVSSLRVPLDRARMLEVLVIRGTGSVLSDLAGRIAGTRGVEACALTPATSVAQGVRRR